MAAPHELHAAVSTHAPITARAPWQSAAALAGTYLVLASLYIFWSSSYASALALSVLELRHIEILKGLAFVGVTSLGLFAFNWYQLLGLREHQDTRQRIDHALHNAERSILAGTFASSIAHDINNGLSVAMLSLEELQLHVAGDLDAEPLAAETAAALGRIRDWNRRFFELGGVRLLGQAQPFDIALTLRECSKIARRHKAIRETTLSIEVSETPLQFHGREALVQRAALNLLINAAEAAGPGGAVQLTLTESAAECVITVDDSGPGIPVDMRARILEPFFTSKESGSGLGLASVVGCANLHDGTVEITQSALGGARFVVRLCSGARMGASE